VGGKRFEGRGWRQEVKERRKVEAVIVRAEAEDGTLKPSTFPLHPHTLKPSSPDL
jgi:hypothetical protein